MRTSQAWADVGFGNLAIPRVGQEAMVDFLNDDPGQPITMGCTYHRGNRSPGSLPDTKTQMTVRSRTCKGGGFNELCSGDATGQEQVYIHAQENMGTEVLNNHTIDIKVDHTETIGNNQSITVGLGQTVKVGGGNAGGYSQTVTVAHDRSITVRNDQMLRAKNDRMVNVSYDDGLYVANGQKVTVEGRQEHTTTGDHTSLVGDSHCLEMKGDLARKVASVLGIKVRDDIALENSSQMNLRMGGSFIIIQTGGVDIMGPKIDLSSGGSPGTPVGTLLPGVLEALIVDVGDEQDNGSGGGDSGSGGDQDGSGGGDDDQNDLERYHLRFHFTNDDCAPYTSTRYIAHFADDTQKEGMTDDEGYTEVFIKDNEEEIRSHLFL